MASTLQSWIVRSYLWGEVLFICWRGFRCLGVLEFIEWRGWSRVLSIQPKILEFFFIKSNGMNRFSLVGLTGMFTSNTFTGLVISVGWIKMSLSIWQKFLFPVPLCCILLTSTITNLFMLFKSTVKPWLSVPWLSGLFDYLDLFPWSWFFSWILVRCDLEKLKRLKVH